MLVHIFSNCELSFIMVRLINLGFGNDLFDTERVLGESNPSPYSGAKSLLYGVSVFPNHGNNKLLHEPSNDWYLIDELQKSFGLNGQNLGGNVTPFRKLIGFLPALAGSFTLFLVKFKPILNMSETFLAFFEVRKKLFGPALRVGGVSIADWVKLFS